MSAFSDELAAVAQSLLAEFGQAVTFTRSSPGAYDPAIAATSPPTVTTYSGYGLPVNSSSNGDTVEIGATADQRTAVGFYLSSSTEPEVNDSVVISPRTLRVLSVERTSVTGATVLYYLRLSV